MSATPDLSIVILSWNTRELTLACLRALERDTTRLAREIIVVDNHSGDGSADAVAQAFPYVVLVRNEENRLYAAGNNQGVERATGRYVCLLNSDTEVVPGALDILVRFLAENPEYGAVSPRLNSFDGSVQRACTRFPGLLDVIVDSTHFSHTPIGKRRHARTRMHDFDHQSTRDVDQPPGAVFMMRREEYIERGGLDEELSLFYNDVDLCRRLWASGRKIRYIAEAQVFHHQGASTSRSARVQSLWADNRLSYYAKHHGLTGAVWVRFVRWLAQMQIAAGVVLGPRAIHEKIAALNELGAQARR
ncbi:MAG: glycosyltransferase family 2 protein [Planctomycetes bacterium]|nr:glycosyltransferase family 2 protein [Planctomycetota bacterium]